MSGTMRSTRRTAALAAAVTALAMLTSPVAQAVAAPLAATEDPNQGHVATAASAPSAAVAEASDYSSIFSGENASLTGSGWSTCAAPVQWSLDTRGLNPATVSKQVANLTWAFDQWGKASGLTFQYAGEQDVVYDDAAFTVKPADGTAVQSRHIYLDFVTQAESARLTGGVVGLGSPSQVMPSTKEIISGEAVFRTDHVQQATTKQVRSLYLHELGHVLGLAHAQVTSNVMYPIVTDRTRLGAGDVNGVVALEKTCSASANESEVED